MAILYPPFRIMNERMARIQKKIRIPLFSKKKKKKKERLSVAITVLLLLTKM